MTDSTKSKQGGTSAPVNLADLLRNQRELMNALGIQAGPVDDVLTSSLYKDVLIMLAGEVQEALEPLTLSTKPWKQVDKEMLRAHALEELIDVLFFVLEAFELAGLSAEEVGRRYEDKRGRNFRRATQSREMEVTEATPREETVPQITGLEILSALQRAAGMATSITSRSVLWQAVWDAEALEASAEAKAKNPNVTLDFVLGKLRNVNESFGVEDKDVIMTCLQEQLGNKATAELLKRIEWTHGSA